MKITLRLLTVALLLTCITATAWAQERLRLSTTTSTDNSGLLQVMLPVFEKKHNVKVDVIAVGTGKALKLAEAGDVDVTLVHARELEDKFVADGFGVNRRDVMYNDFVLLGPAKDPARVKEAQTAADAFGRIARTNARWWGPKTRFISRGDESGTHVMEKALWKASGVAPKGRWYVEAGAGMGEIINMATEQQAYTLSDRGTYIAYQGKTDLQILFAGDKSMFNPYGIIAVNPAKHPHIKYDLAMALVEFMTSAEGQKIIENFKLNGQQLFFIYK
jgi:tungstate transport system substrate-binding protein